MTLLSKCHIHLITHRNLKFIVHILPDLVEDLIDGVLMFI